MKIIKDSHLDHGLSEAHIEFIREQFKDKGEFFIWSGEMPEHLPSLTCRLHGPVTGGEPVEDDEAFFEQREGRAWSSRMCAREPVETRVLTVIAGPHEGEACVLYTAYGGPLAPREIGDPDLGDDERERSKLFWARHALS